MPVQTQIQIRRDVATAWTTQVLAAGEFGLDTTNNILKLGNGSTAWSSLASIKSGGIIASPTNTQLLVQTGVNTTGMLTAGTTNYMLVQGAFGPTWSNALTSPTINTSLVPGGTSFDLANTVATAINLGNAATAFNIGTGTPSANKVVRINSSDTTSTLPAAYAYTTQINNWYANAGTATLDLGGGVNLTGANTVNIGAFSSTNSGTNTVNIGSTVGTTTVNLRGNTVHTGSITTRAGTATAGTAPMYIPSGINLTTPVSGALEYDGKSVYFTTSGTTGRATIPASYYVALATATNTGLYGTGGTGSMFNKAVTLTASTTHEWEMYYYANISNSSVAASIPLYFDLSTSLVQETTFVEYSISTSDQSATAATLSTRIKNASSQLTLGTFGATLNQVSYLVIKAKGILRNNSGADVSFFPTLGTAASPSTYVSGTTLVVQSGSFFKVTPLGSDTFVSTV